MNRDLYYEFLRWLKTSWKFQAGFGLLVVAVSLAVSFVWCAPEYFSRSGALMNLAEVFMTFRRYLRGSDIPYLRNTGEADRPAFSPKDLLRDKANANQQDNSAMNWGIVFLIAGTLIWGYGDLALFSICHR